MSGTLRREPNATVYPEFANPADEVTAEWLAEQACLNPVEETNSGDEDETSALDLLPGRRPSYMRRSSDSGTMKVPISQGVGPQILSHSGSNKCSRGTLGMMACLMLGTAIGALWSPLSKSDRVQQVKPDNGLRPSSSDGDAELEYSSESVVSTEEAVKIEVQPSTNGQAVAVATTRSEQDILDRMKPQWFGRKDGYNGTTYDHAMAFCNGIGDRVLCPVNAYCPSTDKTEKKLFLQRDPFEGEQWSPVASYFDKLNVWVSVGEMAGGNTCKTYDQMYEEEPGWGTDSTKQESKENVLCCQNPGHAGKEQKLIKHLNPIWIDASQGWGLNGLSHGAAMQFCESFANRKLCPYEIYCPNGSGQPAIGGHVTDFNTEGEQWAPMYGTKDNWVMIGRKHERIAYTCMNSVELPMPDWEHVADGEADMKRHILCCSF
ncbi:hypothetical protein ACHAWF_006281 [Thalassiosira exigua]